MIDNNIDKIVQKLCDAGAGAIRRYVAVSGESPKTIPEYFLSASIFNALSEDRAITLETPFWQIHKWESEGREIPALDEGASGWKLDIVLYDGLGSSPQEQKALAFVEIKNGYIDADSFDDGRRVDRDKLTTLGKIFLDSKPHLICAGAVNADRRDYHIRMAKKQNDRWFQSSACELPYGHEDQYFCARLIR